MKCARCGDDIEWVHDFPESPGEYHHLHAEDDNDLARCPDGEMGYPAPPFANAITSPAEELPRGPRPAKIKVGSKVRAKHRLVGFDPTPVPEGMTGVVSGVGVDAKFGWYMVTFDNGVDMFINLSDNCDLIA